jgi:hypothetical protein
MAKVTSKQHASHARHRRLRRDPPGRTRTFHVRTVKHILVGGLGVVMGALAFAAAIYYPFFAPGSSSAGQTAEMLLLAVSVGLVLGWMGIRQFRDGVQVSGQKLTIRNEFRTSTVDAADIRAINLQPMDSPNGRYWVPRVELTSGKSVWIDNFDCGPAGRPPRPDRVAIVEEVRTLLGLGDADPAAETR